jgi:hypothetical protein
MFAADLYILLGEKLMNTVLVEADEEIIVDCGEVSLMTQGGWGPKIEPSFVPERPLGL